MLNEKEVQLTMANKEKTQAGASDEPVLLTDTTRTVDDVSDERGATPAEQRPGVRQIASWYKFPLLLLLLSLVMVCLLVAAYKLGQHNPEGGTRRGNRYDMPMMHDYDGYGPRYRSQSTTQSTAPTLQTN